MNGFGVEGKSENPFYSISRNDKFEWNEANYSILQGPAYVILFSVMLFVTGSLVDKYNRKNILWFACIGWSSVTFAHAYA